jgi:amidohydrolase
VWPELKTGVVGLKQGVVTAAADRWECELRGPGGHAARPFETVDLIRLAARVVGALVDVPRTFLNPVNHPTIVTVTKIHGGEVFNVIPDRLSLGGTVRTLDPRVREKVAEEMERLLRGMCEPAGAAVNWFYYHGAPALTNHPTLTALTRRVVEDLFGPQALVPVEQPSMGAEDFSHFSERVPGLLLRLGCTPPGQQYYPLHSTRFRVDEDALGVGVSLLSALALL